MRWGKKRKKIEWRWIKLIKVTVNECDVNSSSVGIMRQVLIIFKSEGERKRERKERVERCFNWKEWMIDTQQVTKNEWTGQEERKRREK